MSAALTDIVRMAANAQQQPKMNGLIAGDARARHRLFDLAWAAKTTFEIEKLLSQENVENQD